MLTTRMRRAGNGDIDLSSINVRISLGSTINGRPAGNIFLTSKIMAPRLYAPELLDYSALVAGNEVITDNNDALRQILTPETFADIVTQNDYAYEIRFYHARDAGPKNGMIHTVESGASPYVIWRFENPDGNSGSKNRLKISEIRDSGIIVSEYHYDEASGAWSLAKGNGSLIITKTAGAAPSSCDKIVKNGSGGISLHTREVFGAFPWGESVIKKIKSPSGANLTTNYTYYEDAGNAGAYGKVRSVGHSDGSWIYMEKTILIWPAGPYAGKTRPRRNRGFSGHL